MLSFIPSFDDSKHTYYSMVSDIQELEELIISAELSNVTAIAERFDISVIYFEGGTLVIDDYSDRNIA